MNIDNLTTKDFDRPEMEKVTDVIEISKPRNRNVICVMGYGFPFAFLTNGAEHVIGFDVNPYQVRRNQNIEKVIRQLPYISARRILIGDLDDEDFQAIPGASDCDWREFIHSLLSETRGDPQIFEYYPFVENPIDYETAQRAILSGKLKIIQGEMLDAICSVEDDSVDIVYASSVRNWVACMGYNIRNSSTGWDTPASRADLFKTEYDGELSRLLGRKMKRNGIYYDVLINSLGFPKIRMDQRIFDGFEISVARKTKDSTIMIARKK